MTQSKVVQPGTGRHEEKEYEMARYWKGKLVGRKKKWDTFSINPYKVKILLESNQYCCWYWHLSALLLRPLSLLLLLWTTTITTATVNTTICTTATSYTVTTSTSIASAIKFHHCYCLELKWIHVFNSVLTWAYYIFFLQEEKAIGGGGDLMADLHAKLSMRRKVWIVSLCMEFLLNGVWG
jgi:hypothetical protein